MDFENIRQLYLQGHSTIELGQRFNISQGRINTILKGCRRSSKEAAFVSFKMKYSGISDKIISLFNDGLSVKAISTHQNMCRSTIKKILIVNEIQPRNRSEAMFNMSKQSSKEQRYSRVKAAHDSTRGRKKSKSCGRKQAIRKFKTKSKVGMWELQFIDWITKNGFKCELICR